MLTRKKVMLCLLEAAENTKFHWLEGNPVCLNWLQIITSHPQIICQLAKLLSICPQHNCKIPSTTDPSHSCDKHYEVRLSLAAINHMIRQLNNTSANNCYGNRNVRWHDWVSLPRWIIAPDYNFYMWLPTSLSKQQQCERKSCIATKFRSCNVLHG